MADLYFQDSLVKIQEEQEIKNVITFLMEYITAPSCGFGTMIIFFWGVKLQDMKQPSGYVDLLLGVHETCDSRPPYSSLEDAELKLKGLKRPA